MLPQAEAKSRYASPEAELKKAIDRAGSYLLSRQSPSGFWRGELEADASVTAGYIPLMHFMGVAVKPERVKRIIQSLRDKQNLDGSWSAYYAGPGDLSVTAQVYFCLKLAGVSAGEGFMLRARDFIRNRGGMMKLNLISRIWFAIFGQFDWKGIPTVPPEIIFLPNWFYFNIYEASSWARETIVALSILTDRKPVSLVPDSARMDELYIEPRSRRQYKIGSAPRFLSWETAFLALDRIFKLYQNNPLKPFRTAALNRSSAWIVDHQEKDGSWGGIMLPWIYSLFALKSLGYDRYNRVISKGLEGIEFFIEETRDSFLMQPALSPVWDTAWSVLALRESGISGEDSRLRQAAKWLVGSEIRVGGDWKIKNPDTQPGCWAFEFENQNYPDLDDTSVVPRALASVRTKNSVDEAAKQASCRRGTRWVLDMQGDDGGWAAFDKNNNKTIFAHIPFSDFITPLDPGSPDVTAHVIELLSQSGSECLPYFQKGLEYLKNSQQEDGSWYGRWGVNYIYGTGLVLACLQAAGEDPDQAYIKKGARWLKEHQNADGGWGESCKSYEDPALRGKGESTASQTAWALIGLIGAGETHSQAARRGIDYLVETQAPNGGWIENHFTGTGFPRAFYLRYGLYKIYFPLMAMAKFWNSQEESYRQSLADVGRTTPSDRILLLPHCLRRSQKCKGSYGQQGLVCAGCDPTCPVNRLTRAARNLGYKGICVAPGGRLAVNFVKEFKPKAVVAVACEKELEEGIQGVRDMDGISEIAVGVIPLVKDGCIDTEVDEIKALEMINAGGLTT